jgi:Protein of unknown function (DUF3179)
MIPAKKPGLTTAFVLFVLTLLSFGLLIYPLMVIQPFRHQGVSELQTALRVMRWRPYFEAAAVAGASAIVVWYWRRRSGIWLRLFACVAALLVCAAAVLSRVNVYEIMFHHYDRPSFSPASESKLDGDEKVIAIALHGQARAYPIRSMSYHHVVNDEVGGIPVVATY